MEPIFYDYSDLLIKDAKADAKGLADRGMTVTWDISEDPQKGATLMAKSKFANWTSTFRLYTSKIEAWPEVVAALRA